MEYGNPKEELKLGQLGKAKEKIASEMEDDIFRNSADKKYTLEPGDIRTLLDEFVVRLDGEGFEIKEKEEEE